MSRNRELCLGSRYIHTGNSGVTVSVLRNVRRVDRAQVLVETQTMGAFDSCLCLNGNSYEGFTAVQLQDLALVLLNAAEHLTRPDKASFEMGSPSLVGADGERGGDPPDSLRHRPSAYAKSIEKGISDRKPWSVQQRLQQLIAEE